jgi:hypothetical protein
MSSRVSPTDRIRAEIDALFTGGRDLVEVLEDVACLGARLLIQTAVEAEVAEFSAVPATSAPPPLPRPSRDTVTAPARPRSRRPAVR